LRCPSIAEGVAEKERLWPQKPNPKKQKQRKNPLLKKLLARKVPKRNRGFLPLGAG